MTNVLLPTDSGTTQIDHLIFSPFGIFVMELKNMKGKIYGKANETQWTQFFSKTKTFKFQNPLRQNYKHVKIVEAIIGAPPESFRSIVIFTGFVDKLPEIPNVLKPLAAIDSIRAFKTPILSEQDLETYFERIRAASLESGRANEKEHISHVKEIVEGKDRKTPPAVPVPPVMPPPVQEELRDGEPVLCPRCGSEMVHRISKKKEDAKPFWGCSRFPKCRGVVSIDS